MHLKSPSWLGHQRSAAGMVPALTVSSASQLSDHKGASLSVLQYFRAPGWPWKRRGRGDMPAGPSSQFLGALAISSLGAGVTAFASVFPMVPYTRGHSHTSRGSERRKGRRGEDQTMGKGKQRCQEDERKDTGPVHLGFESGQSGLWPMLFLDCFVPKRAQQARSLTVRTSALVLH